MWAFLHFCLWYNFGNMKLGFLPLVVLLLASVLFAQETASIPAASGYDQLLNRHISAAETFQISGDLDNAEVENRAIVGIALEEIGNHSLEKGETEKASDYLRQSLGYRPSPSARLSLGLARMRAGDFDEALLQANAAVEKNPESAYFRYVLGNIYYNKGDFKAALPHLEKSFVLRPDFNVARALGMTYLNLREVERARLLFEEIQTALKAPNAQLHILFGQAYEVTGYAVEAEQAFQRASEINPKQLKANFYRGFVILQHAGSERLGDALSAFRKELELTPEDFYSNFFAGVTAVSLNDLESSTPYLEKAVALKPESVEAHLFLGQSYLDEGKFDRAETHLKKSIEMDMKKKKRGVQARRSHFMLSRVYIKQKKRDEARQQLAIARDLQLKELQNSRDEINRILGQVGSTNEPSSATNVQLTPTISDKRRAAIAKRMKVLSPIIARAYHNLGVIAIQRKNTEGGTFFLEKALTWKADFPGVRRNLGIVSFQAKDYEATAEHLSEHLKSQPNDILARRMLGTSFYLMNRFKETTEVLKPFGDSIIADAELAYFYGLASVQIEDVATATRVFEKMAAQYGNEAPKLFFAAQGFMFLGDFKRAIVEFDRVLSQSPSFQKANYFRGQSFIRLSRFEEAETAFKNELSLNSSDALSKYHLALTLIERRIRTDEAIKHLTEVLLFKPDYADARYQLGKIYIEQNKIPKAIEELESALKIDFNKDYIHYQLSIAYRKASRREDSKRHLELYRKIKAEKRKNSDPQPMGGNQ